jgi:hypothetical protein
MDNRLPIFALAVGILVSGASPVAARQANASDRAEAPQIPDFREVLVPDGKRQIAQLSRKLKLKGPQKRGVLAILSDRDRDIALIRGSEVLSADAKASRIAAIVAEYNAHIEDVLNGKQKHKFEQVLIREREREEKNRQADSNRRARLAV